MIRHIAIFLCSLLMCSTTFADSVTSVSLGALLTALNERMLLMKDVAAGNDSNLLIVFYVQIMPDDFVMQLHRF